MANIHQYSLAGVGPSVRVGKGNGYLNFNSSTGFEVKDPNNSGFATFNVATPTTSNHAATKDYVDNLVQGLVVKPESKAATTANISLVGLQIIDGYQTQANDVVMVKNQTIAAQNGLYNAASGSWTRIINMNTSTEVPGSFSFVANGTINAGRGFVVTGFASGNVLGTDPIVWTQFSSAGYYTNGDGLSLTNGVFSVLRASNSGLNFSGAALRLSITDLATASTVTNADLVPISQSGTTVYTTVGNLLSVTSATTGRRAVVTANSTNHTFNIGPVLPNLAGLTTYVGRVKVSVTTPFTGGSVNQARISDGTNVLMTFDENDVLANGTYMSVLSGAFSSNSGQCTMQFFQSDGTSTAIPTAGACVAVIEFDII